MELEARQGVSIRHWMTIRSSTVHVMVDEPAVAIPMKMFRDLDVGAHSCGLSVRDALHSAYVDR